MKSYSILTALIALAPISLGAMDTEPVVSTALKFSAQAVGMSSLFAMTKLAQKGCINLFYAADGSFERLPLYMAPTLVLGSVGFGYATKYGIIDPIKTAVTGLWDAIQPFKKTPLTNRVVGLAKAGLATAMIGYSANLIHRALS